LTWAFGNYIAAGSFAAAFVFADGACALSYNIAAGPQVAAMRGVFVVLIRHRFHAPLSSFLALPLLYGPDAQIISNDLLSSEIF
jgi:hypothetical protein